MNMIPTSVCLAGLSDSEIKEIRKLNANGITLEFTPRIERHGAGCQIPLTDIVQIAIGLAALTLQVVAMYPWKPGAHWSHEKLTAKVNDIAMARGMHDVRIVSVDDFENLCNDSGRMCCATFEPREGGGSYRVWIKKDGSAICADRPEAVTAPPRPGF